MANTKQRKKTTPNKNKGLFILSWVLVAILIIALFFAKKDTISSNLKSTDFFAKLSGKSKAESQNVYTEATGSENIKAQIEDAKIDPSTQSEQKETQTSTKKTTPATAATKTVQHNNVTKSTSDKKEQTIPKPAAPTMAATLFFVTVTSDGTVSRKIIKRDIPKSSSPLTATIKTLLAGPTTEDKKQGATSLIPLGTKLLGASVKNGIATLNFSDDLEFNSVGVDGYMATLMQIVYTATQFPTVKSVKFLIEGNEREYLGSDGLLPGLYIKTPLARNSF